VSAYDMALAFVGMDDKDQAFFWLDKAVSEPRWAADVRKCRARFDSVRSDPRYADLVRRLRFPS